MTTINCTSNCTYQNNGKCGLQNVQLVTSNASDGNCAYFSEIKDEGVQRHDK